MTEKNFEKIRKIVSTASLRRALFGADKEWQRVRVTQRVGSEGVKAALACTLPGWGPLLLFAMTTIVQSEGKLAKSGLVAK